MGWDLALLENGNGGDITIQGNDVGVFYFDENEIYLRMMGGNREGSSKKNRRAGEDDPGYWANGLLFNHEPEISFNSLTERTLDTTPLTSQGRTTIEKAIAKDLEGLDVTVSVQIVSDDRLRVTLRHIVTQKQASFSLVRNVRTGDWDLNDFNALDFF